MPHCQKEKHNHSSKSKKSKQAKKEALALARKQKAEGLEEAEKEKLKAGNNLALKDGFGEYEVGCEEEMEYVAKFNMNKRSKKHLRMDIIKQQQKAEREAEERLRQQQEEAYRLQQQQEKNAKSITAEEEKELVIQKEVLVYICLCCNKKFNTVNAFKNHTDSKKHRDAARLYEEAGVIVTEVLLANESKEEEEDDDGYDFEEGSYEDIGGDGEGGEGESTKEETKRDGGYGSEGESEGEGNDDEEEEEEEERKVGSLFSALAAFSDSSSSSSSSSSESSDDDEDEDEENCTTSISEHLREVDVDADAVEENGTDWDDDLDLLEDIIYQNRLQEQFYPEDGASNEGGEEAVKVVEKLAPVAFDDEQYDIDNFNADRLAAVQHRLQKRLAAKGIEPSQIQPGYKTSSTAVSVGKTLLQEVMEASVETRQRKLAQYKQHKAEHQLLGREFRFAKGNSKALASQYSYRIDPSDNARQRANVHHAGSHYHMAAARSMYYGRSKGLMARHSSQGSRLQATRMAAKETVRTHGKGMAKVGKTSKKSNQKRRGEAGGSKKSGGMAGVSEK